MEKMNIIREFLHRHEAGIAKGLLDENGIECVLEPDYCGGFVTSAGPEVIVTMATAIPVLTPEMLEHLKRTDDDIQLKLTDVVGRREIAGD